MEETPNNAAPTAEQGAAQPDTGAAPAKSAAETKLEGQLSAATTKGERYKKERDAARKDLSTALGTITAQGEEIEQLKREKAPADGAKAGITTDEQPTDTPADEHAETKAIMQRNGLKKAWILPDGAVCFQESHAKHVAGAGFDSLTVISAE